MERSIVFYSAGIRLADDLHVPDDIQPGQTRAGIVLCHGFVGIKDLILPDLARVFLDVGYIVLRFDYRGFGASDGPRFRLIPMEQVEDVRNALTFLANEPEVNAERLGVYGTSFGGGNAIMAAAMDERIRCTVATVPVANGKVWLRGMRRFWEWKEFLARIEADRDRRVMSGESQMVESDDVMVPDPESHKWHIQVLERFPERAYQVPLESAEAVLDCRPEDMVRRIAPRPVMFIHAGDDDLVPVEMSRALYDRAGDPKRLPKHHALYSGAPFHQVMSAATDWFSDHLPST